MKNRTLEFDRPHKSTAATAASWVGIQDCLLLDLLLLVSLAI
jgi:hypothetical protein